MLKRIVEWSVSRPVVANLLMVFLLMVGGYLAWTMRKEMFPEFSLDTVAVSVVYKGASVEEIEESICSKIEEEITGIEGIKKITATAVEGKGTVTAELEAYANVNRVLSDVKNAVDQIDTFPLESERPVTVEVLAKFPVVKVAVYGDVSEQVLTSLAEKIETDLLALPGISQVELIGRREYEVSIEISEYNLRKFGLSLTGVADLIRQNTLDLPGGTLRAESGQILLRTKGQRYTAKEFEDLVVVSRPDGAVVPLSRIARITDTFEEVDLQARMDGKPAVLVSVDKTSTQDSIDISRKVKDYVSEYRKSLPSSIGITVWDDNSVYIESRLDLMIRNGGQGLVLVVILLALFLRLRLAFWVVMGIPISILGSFTVLGYYDHSLNMISMYSFIVVLGIVVDDAIVIGENVYTRISRGEDQVTAAVNGSVEIGYPVVNSVATTIVAFSPMLFIPGTMGKFMGVFPLAIIAVLLVSLAEVFVILPAHLAHMKSKEDPSRRWSPFILAERMRTRVQAGLDHFVEHIFLPFMKATLRSPYVVTALVVAALVLCLGLVAGGRIGFVFFPKMDSDKISAQLVMPEGTSFQTTQAAVRKLESAARQMAAQYQGKDGLPIIEHMFAIIGEHAVREAGTDKGSHIADVIIELLESGERGVPSSELAAVWRKHAGEIPDAISLQFSSSMGGRPGGKPIEIDLEGRDFDQLLAASNSLKKELARFDGVEDVEDSYRPGKMELRLSLKEGARQLGVTLQDLARQTRAGFWGEEALKVQRGRNEVIIRVRYPEKERIAPGDLDNMKIRTADNYEIPFLQIATVDEYRGPASIKRKHGRRVVTVSADVDEDRSNAREIVSELSKRFFPELQRNFPEVSISLEGQQKETADTLGSLLKGFFVALFLIYVLLVNMFRTYSHPLIVLTAVPFSFVGIIIGHMLFGMDFTVLSMFGVLALTGIVVNDSLLLIEASNRAIQAGCNLEEGLMEGARNRFRQIILTSLSTAAGLTPILLETSFQAQYLKPMTITVVFGILTSTALILLLVPALCVIRADILTAIGRHVPGRS
ncbi:MAG: efflux RND transporter permease subunit [Desulfomonilaceae bacterium]|nr:efflux RND transporter permease subunit [Desulfomonilaceae bacterium]